MSYYPDNDLCLLSIEVGEKTPEPVFANGWKRFWANDADKKKDEDRQCVLKRNGMKTQEAVQGIAEAQADKYEPVFYTQNKGLINAIGVRGRSSDLSQFSIGAVRGTNYIQKIREILSNFVKSPGNVKELHTWEELLDQIAVE